MTNELQAEIREDFKQSSTKYLRDHGKVPAVLYGNTMDATAIQIDGIEFKKTLREIGRNGIFDLSVKNEHYSVMVHEIQKDALKNEILHADFHVVDLNKEVEVEVAVSLVGDAEGVKDGGVLQQSLHALSVRSKPQNIPTVISVNISDLNVNETITVGDIETGSLFEINHEETQVIASILPPKQEAEINSGEEQEPGTPESEEGRETAAEE